LTAFYLGVFALSLTLSFALTKFVRDICNHRRWVAAPSLERHLHETPLPRFGGVAIFFSLQLSLTVAWLVSHRDPHFHFGAPGRTVWTILLPGMLIFLLGVYDDVRRAGPYLKFSVQAMAATMLYYGGLRVDALPLVFGPHLLPWFVALPLTIVWVLAITNAFNLIDGLDGLAAGSALFSTLVVFVVALQGGFWLVVLMTIALAGAILGFLRFNFNPATIFLGDCGSLFIGFLLSALALEGTQKATTIIAVAIPVVSFGLPILETTLSVLRRIIGGRPVFTADREHIHHRLLHLGLSHRQVVIVLYAVSALFALLSLFLLWPSGSTVGLVLAVLGTGIWLGVQRLGYLEFGELARVAHRTMEQRQIVINNLAIRRAAEELKAVRDQEQLRRVLTAAFSSNDFDGFELTIQLAPGEVQVATAALGRPPSTPAFSMSWNKPGTALLTHSAAWSLYLDLVTSAGRRRGSLKLLRSYAQRNLQLDVNLLTTGFPGALADAVDRTLAAPVPVLGTLAERPGFGTAQAD
jgi:UDP-GlcNAc:undecaprenyl-phosphate GlcNAc-1-phosphate transferase